MLLPCPARWSRATRNGVVEQKNLSLVKLGMSLKISSESRIPVSQTWRGAETSSDFHNPNRADMRLFNNAVLAMQSLAQKDGCPDFLFLGEVYFSLLNIPLEFYSIKYKTTSVFRMKVYYHKLFIEPL